MSYCYHLLLMIGIYLPLVYSLNLILGFGGLVSFCHACFYGLGAYSYALLLTTEGISPAVALPLTIGIVGILGIIIGVVALRFRGDMFIFVTLGFQMIISAVLHNWVSLTNGPYGIVGIPRPELFGFTLRSPLQFVIAITLVDILILGFLLSVYRSPFGITLKALREDETGATALGINREAVCLQAFAIAATIAAIPGVFYAAYITYIDPTSFTLKESIFQIAILLLGGAGNRKGPVIGVVLLLLLPEVLRFVGLPDSIAHNGREIIYGLLLVGLMYFRPQGIAGEFRMN